jgi:hypothetical protein
MPVKYSFIEADSGYYIIEDPENENLYKCAFPTRVLYRSNQRKSLLSIDCEEYFNVANADTSFYYLTNSLPKSAGVVQFKNIESCIFGISDNYASIFPIGIKGEVKELISLPNKSIQIINSIDSNLVNGRTGGISIGKQFPRFVAKDVHGKKVSSADFQNHNSSVVIFWDHIKSKEVGNPKKIQYEKYYNDQIEEILLALDSVCMLKAAELFSFSTEYLENISKPRYFFVDHLKCLHFVTNSDRWQSRLNIIADPLIILINNKGSITEILSPLDFPEENLVGFFIERISEKAKGQ